MPNIRRVSGRFNRQGEIWTMLPQNFRARAMGPDELILLSVDTKTAKHGLANQKSRIK